MDKVLLAQLAVLLLIFGTFLFFALRSKPKPPKPPEPPAEQPKPPSPSEPPLKLLGIDVRAPIMAPWFNPLDWPPDHYPAGSALCFRPIWQDNAPLDPIKPSRFDWFLLRFDPERIIAMGQSGVGNEWCYSGEMFIGGGCGDPNPKCYRIVCQMKDTAGNAIAQVEKQICAVSDKACRR